METANAILFTRRVLHADSDDQESLLKATEVCEQGITSWPRYYLNVSEHTWLHEVDMQQAYRIAEDFEGRAQLLTGLFMRKNPSLSEVRARDLAQHVAAVFHERPMYTICGTRAYEIAIARCTYVGSLSRTVGKKHYVLTWQEQLDEWVAGNPMHNYVRGECCPDFSCCSPGLLTPIDMRKKFATAPDDQRMSMLSMMLTGLTSQSDTNVYVAGQNQTVN